MPEPGSTHPNDAAVRIVAEALEAVGNTGRMSHDLVVTMGGPQDLVTCRRCGMVWLMEFMGYVDKAAAEADRDCEDDGGES